MVTNEPMGSRPPAKGDRQIVHLSGRDIKLIFGVASGLITLGSGGVVAGIHWLDNRYEPKVADGAQKTADELEAERQRNVKLEQALVDAKQDNSIGDNAKTITAIKSVVDTLSANDTAQSAALVTVQDNIVQVMKTMNDGRWRNPKELPKKIDRRLRGGVPRDPD